MDNKNIINGVIDIAGILSIIFTQDIITKMVVCFMSVIAGFFLSKEKILKNKIKQSFGAVFLSVVFLFVGSYYNSKIFFLISICLSFVIPYSYKDFQNIFKTILKKYLGKIEGENKK